MNFVMNQSYNTVTPLEAVAVPGETRAALSLGSRLLAGLELWSAWRARMQQRRELAALDERALVDLGLDRQQVMAEVEKPFWRP